MNVQDTFIPKEQSLELTASELSPLQTAFEDFGLSRQAMHCTPATLEFYRYSAGAFLSWLQARGIDDPKAVAVGHVREWLAEAEKRGLKDTSLLARAKGVRTFLKFLHGEGYIPQVITFAPCPGSTTGGSCAPIRARCVKSWARASLQGSGRSSISWLTVGSEPASYAASTGKTLTCERVSYSSV